MTDFSPPAPNPSLLGQRLLITGNSCFGKSTLGAQLASVLDVPFVELDALNWEPDWVGLNDTNPNELMRRMQKATCILILKMEKSGFSKILRIKTQH